MRSNSNRKAITRTEDRGGRKRRVRSRQQSFEFKSWGGARRGAGRKPKGERPGMPHRVRAAHPSSVPVQVTTRLREGLGSLRRQGELELIRQALAQSARRGDFRVVHHSVQSNHLHLIVEAEDRTALSLGMRGLLVRIARALNRLWMRRGSVFADRFHERALRTPREVRQSLVYVLQNARKHGLGYRGADPYSSGERFDGWEDADALAPSREEEVRNRVPTAAWREALERSVSAARTWLLAIGWKRCGLIHTRESPRPAVHALR
jgi:REP element-mobilizing transposase RayT